MRVITDLQLHSRFSRAVSKEMTLPNIALWARRKGIGVVATGDWTHPMWFREIERDLEETGNGLLRLKPQQVDSSQLTVNSNTKEASVNRELSTVNPFFLLATEVSSIYKQGSKTRRIHTLIWVPTLAAARKISQEMTKRGCNLMSDGRPIIGLTSIQVAELVFSIEPKALVIPAHAWTPWFSVYGSLGGFDSIEEAFGEYADRIYAVETGLSSNPSMNWRIKELDNRAILSFSDAHSGPKLGREATVFDFPDGKLSYEAVYQAIKHPHALVANENFGRSSEASQDSPVGNGKSSEERQNFVGSPHVAPSIAFTIEFYPEEGKYHYTGHRACNVRLTPQETREKGAVCPVCGKQLTQGVMHRVEELAGRSEADLQLSVLGYRLSDSGQSGVGKSASPVKRGEPVTTGKPKTDQPDTENRKPKTDNRNIVQMTYSKAFPHRPPYIMLVPLIEIISEAVGSPVASPKVQPVYAGLIDAFGSEFAVLLETSPEDIAAKAGERVAEGIVRVRTGNIHIDPGYDGVFGVVKIWGNGNERLVDKTKEQLSIFS